MSTIEVRGNIMGDIMKIRKGVIFQDVKTVVDELVQNSQRAEASKIEVQLLHDRLTLRDDGVGCEDPQVVFEKSTTAWGNDASEEAFGEGFFSAFLIADKLTVHSKDWKVVIDVLDMIETRKLDFEVRAADYIEGFEVILEGNMEDDYWTIKDEFRFLGKIVEPEVVLNGDVIEKEDVLAKTHEYAQTFDNEVYTATLSPARGYEHVELYYENRPVRRELENGLNGALMFKRNAVTLKAPDRKELIWDDKRNKFRSQLKEDRKRLYMKMLEEMTDEEQLNEYADEIADNVPIEDYIHIIPFSEDLLDLAGAKEMNKDDWYKDEGVRERNAESLRNTLKEMGIKTQEREKEPSEWGKVPLKDRENKLINIKNPEKLVWVRADEVDAYKEQIAEAEYLGFKVMISKNALYSNAYEYLEIVHVDDLQDEIKETVVIKNEEPQTKKEWRVLSLLRRIEDYYNLDETFRLGSITLKLESAAGVITREDENRTSGLYQSDTGKIYIDRSNFDFPSFRAQDPDYENVTFHDMRMLLQGMETISHELAHKLYGTQDNTKEHYQAMSKIQAQISREVF